MTVLCLAYIMLCLLVLQINDFKKLESATDNAQAVAVVGGGFLGSELACALGKKG